MPQENKCLFWLIACNASLKTAIFNNQILALYIYNCQKVTLFKILCILIWIIIPNVINLRINTKRTQNWKANFFNNSKQMCVFVLDIYFKEVAISNVKLAI